MQRRTVSLMAYPRLSLILTGHGIGYDSGVIQVNFLSVEQRLDLKQELLQHFQQLVSCGILSYGGRSEDNYKICIRRAVKGRYTKELSATRRIVIAVIRNAIP